MEAHKAQVANTIHRGEFWTRCPSCGDSDHNPNKAHYSINLQSGKFFCYRCSYSGILRTHERYQLFGMLPVELHVERGSPLQETDSWDAFEEIYERLEKGPAWSRRSLLPRYHYVDDNDTEWDAFVSKDIHGEPSGVLLRLADFTQKRSYFYGERGYAWPMLGKDDSPSSAFDPLRLVEGPYDVMTPQDVVVFGLIGKSTLRGFTGHNIILCPDGDVWTNPSLRKSLKTSLRYLLKSNDARKPHLVGIEYLPNNLDPDQVKVEDRVMFSRGQCFQLLNSL